MAEEDEDGFDTETERRSYEGEIPSKSEDPPPREDGFPTERES